MSRDDPDWADGFYAEMGALPPECAMDEQSARCRQLWAEVLHQAVRDSVSGGRGYECRGLRGEARRWLTAEGTEPCSFRWACMVLDLSADAVLARLQCKWEVQDVRR